MTLIRCDWPSTELRPNFTRSNHWSKWRPISTRYKESCWTLAIQQGVNRIVWPEGDILLRYTFFAPKGCRWDDDAKEGAFKSGQDGIALAMGVDDKHFRAKPLHEYGSDEPCVMVQILTEGVASIPKYGSIS